MPFSPSSGRPLAQFTNVGKTHTVSLQQGSMNVDSHYAYQTLRENVPYEKIARADIVSGEVFSDPRYTSLRITTKDRKFYEIPNLETVHAQKIKSAIEENAAVQRRSGEISSRTKPSASINLTRRF